MTLDTVAYIDAGTGSYILAALAGGAATFWFFLKASVARLFRRGRARDEAIGSTGESSEASEEVSESEQASQQ